MPVINGILFVFGVACLMAVLLAPFVHVLAHVALVINAA